MDKISRSLKNGKVVFWEEIARDGAQAKTLLNASQRIEIAKLHGKIFKNFGPDHLVFAAGFVSIGKEEREIIRETADNVDNCWLAVNCRSNKTEIDQSFDVIKKAEYGRIAFVLPVSERLCRLMLHKTQKETQKYAADIAKYALDKSNGIPVDVQFAAAFDADPVFVAETASILTNEGIATVGTGDTRGRIYPVETENFFKQLKKHSDKDVFYSSHFHDDMGFALINNLIGIKHGILMPSTSWLGLAERNGLLRTELLLLHLAYQPEKLKDKLDINGENLFLSPPDLKMLPLITQKVSNYTGVPIKVTDPVIGTGINTISTGTPFVDTVSFQPFDPEKILGIKRKIFVTQLASKRIIKEVAKQYGYSFNEKQTEDILKEVKFETYKTGVSVLPDNKIKEIFEKFSS